jgi:hypothetical protein
MWAFGLLLNLLTGITTPIGLAGKKKNKGVNDTYVEGIRDEHGNAEDDVRGFWYRFLFLVHDTKARSSSESSLGGIAIPFMGMLRY